MFFKQIIEVEIIEISPTIFFNFNIHHVRVFQWNFILIKINTMYR